MKELARIVEKTEEILGTSSGAWDMVDPVFIASAILEAKGFLQPKREWVGLTDEEMLACNLDENGWMTDRETAKRNVEAKLKEKNT